MNLIRWREGLWALLVLVAAALMACGLADVFTFLVEPPTYPEGHRLVLLGSLAFAGAAVWSWLRQSPRWVSVLTGLPALVVGGLALQFADGALDVLAGFFLIPAALIAMLVELITPYRASELSRSARID
ncbi:hypothetical protein [Pseudarthrobacter sulfonivorans]|uniref:hypothetical protein n=1 Tax=Pseudarthrobacter sulfonivorans TaxID=121292 RepID=UPI0021073ECF|nr:hypothetical protein [Pseudarthrobacter sulfonivorans]